MKTLFSLVVVGLITLGVFALPDDADAVGSLERISGSNRVATAIEVSKRLFLTANSADAVIIVRHDDFADALAANSLAGLANASILLTYANQQLDSAVRTEIDRVLSPGKKVYVVGGTAALPTSIDSGLQGTYSVKRLAGNNRYATAGKLKQEGDVLRGFSATQAIVVRGDNFPDAVSASSYAAFSGTPIILVKQNSIPDESKAFLTPVLASTYIIGGPAAITDSVKNQVEALTSNLSTRIYGANRYATSAAVANFFFASPAAISIATGTSFPDALAGGVLAGKTILTPSGTPMILTKPTSLPAEINSYLKSHAGDIDDLNSGFLFGGTAAVNSDTMLLIESLI